MGTISKWITQNTRPLTMGKTSQQQKGAWAEQQAQAYLQQQGLSFITKNFRCKLGEIDLIMRDEPDLVFIEVRYRKNANFGTALESITASKQRKIIKTAEHYLQRNYQYYPPCRYDIISITGQQLEWIKNAFP